MDDNVALVQRAFAAFGRGDVDAILREVAVDAEWVMPGPSVIPHAGRRRGHADIRQFFEILGNTQSDGRLTINKYVSEGDTVVALGDYRATVNTTGKTLETPVSIVFQIRDGKVVRQDLFSDTAAGAEAYTASTTAAGR